ncbi:MAG: site-specific integrase [Kiloniellales bacterium]
MTDIAIRKLKHPERGQVRYWDESTPAFGLSVSTRSKSFIIMYGKERRLKTIGTYPTLGLSEARQQAKLLLATGPSETTTAITYAQAVSAFLEASGQKNRPKTVTEYTRYLRAPAFSGLLTDVARRDILTHLDGYAGHPTARSHALTAFKVFFNWAVRTELTDKHPLVGEKSTTLQPRSRVLSPDELVRLYRYEDAPFSNILKLLILTGQRRSEIAALHTDWISDDTITIPASVTKNKREHTFPICSLARRLLDGDGHLFANHKGTVFSGWSKSKKRLDTNFALEPWTLHDLRRTFSTIHAELGTPLHVTERLLNHSSGTISGVAAVYNRHTYLGEMRKAIGRYDQYFRNLLCPRP